MHLFDPPGYCAQRKVIRETGETRRGQGVALIPSVACGRGGSPLPMGTDRTRALAGAAHQHCPLTVAQAAGPKEGVDHRLGAGDGATLMAGRRRKLRLQVPPRNSGPSPMFLNQHGCGTLITAPVIEAIQEIASGCSGLILAAHQRRPLAIGDPAVYSIESEVLTLG